MEAGCYLFPQNYFLLCFHCITIEVCPRASPPSLLPFLFRFYVLPLPRKADSPSSVKELGKTLLSECYMHPWVGSNFRSIRKGKSQRSGPKTGLDNGGPTKPWSLGATGTVQSQGPRHRPSLLPFFSLLNTWYFLHPSTWATQCFCEQNRQPPPLRGMNSFPSQPATQKALERRLEVGVLTLLSPCHPWLSKAHWASELY